MSFFSSPTDVEIPGGTLNNVGGSQSTRNANINDERRNYDNTHIKNCKSTTTMQISDDRDTIYIDQNHGTVNIIYSSPYYPGHNSESRQITSHYVHPPKHICNCSAQSCDVRSASGKTNRDTENVCICACKRKSGVENTRAADSSFKDTSAFDSIYELELAENDNDPFGYSLGHECSHYRAGAKDAMRCISEVDEVLYGVTSPWSVSPMASRNPFRQYKPRPEYDAKADVTPDRDKDGIEDQTNAHRLELSEIYRTIRGLGPQWYFYTAIAVLVLQAVKVSSGRTVHRR